MTDILPLSFSWNGEAMIPLNPKAADRQYVVGEVYRLVPQEERSRASHSHFFACINEAWKNLPEDLAERFPSSGHLRKWCLIKAGFRDERSHVCPSKAEAQRLAAFVKPMDDLSVVLVNEATVTVFTAKSQSVRAMGKAEFQRSKDAVFDQLAALIGTDPATLKNAAKAA